MNTFKVTDVPIINLNKYLTRTKGKNYSSFFYMADMAELLIGKNLNVFKKRFTHCAT